MQRTFQAAGSLWSSLRTSLNRWSDILLPHQGWQTERIFVGYLPQMEVECENEKDKGFLWGVPKKRRTVERRMQRRYGFEEWHWKPLRLKTNIRICDTCGHHYEAKHLCRHCYDKVVAETKTIRDAAELKLGHEPENKNIVVLYENELQTVDPKQIEDQMIVEIPKPRPYWFSKNLLQKTTVSTNTDESTLTQDSTTIKPLS